MRELRSGLDPASTAGDPVCTTHTGGADAGWFSLGYFSHQTPDLVASPTLLLRRQQYGSPQLRRLALQCLQLAVPPLQLEGTDPALYVRLSLGQQRIDPTR